MLNLIVFLYFFWFLFLGGEESRGEEVESRLKTVIQHTCTKKPIKQCLTAVLIPATVSQRAKRLLLPGGLRLALRGAQYRVTNWCMCSHQGGSDKNQSSACWTEVSDALVLPAWL